MHRVKHFSFLYRILFLSKYNCEFCRFIKFRSHGILEIVCLWYAFLDQKGKAEFLHASSITKYWNYIYLVIEASYNSLFNSGKPKGTSPVFIKTCSSPGGPLTTKQNENSLTFLKNFVTFPLRYCTTGINTFVSYTLKPFSIFYSQLV